MNRTTRTLAVAALAALLATPAAQFVRAADDHPAAPALNADAGPNANTLTDAEKQAGWKLLFNGQNLDGWNNFKKPGVRPGWQVKNGALTCVDPKNAGDIVTNDDYEWFELQFDYNIAKGGNSGIMFHVTEAAGAPWGTGPEIQLQDNANAKDPELSGWIYQLYKPEVDPKTNKPVDATKPFGEWNHVRVVIAPDKCFTEINGVRYYEFVLNSDDFKSRVEKSKFGKMKDFAKPQTGRLALQGDHGQVAFRNLKVRPIEKK